MQELKYGNCISLYIIEKFITITKKGIFQNEGHKRERDLHKYYLDINIFFYKKKTRIHVNNKSLLAFGLWSSLLLSMSEGNHKLLSKLVHNYAIIESFLRPQKYKYSNSASMISITMGYTFSSQVIILTYYKHYYMYSKFLIHV